MRIQLIVFIPLLLLFSVARPLGPLFADKPHPDLYWKALICMTHNDKETALKIVDAIKNNRPLAIADLVQTHQTKLDEFFDHLFITHASRSPQLLTFLRLFEPIGIREHNAYLNDMSVEAHLQELEEMKACLNQLHSFSCDSLSAQEKLSYEIIDWMLTNDIKGEPFLFHGYVINQIFGILFRITTLFTQFHPLEVEEDVHTYIARLEKVPDQLGQVMQILELQKNQHIIPPQFALQKATTIIKKMMPESTNNHMFFTRLADALTSLNLADKEQLLTRTITILQEQIYPAYQQLQTFITELLATDLPNNGVWALPNGDSYYNYLLQIDTTTHLTAEEIHQIGLKEVANIEAQMREIFAQEKMADDSKSIGELMQELAKDRSFYYPNTDEGRAQCLADYKAIIERTRTELAHLFDLKPAIGVEVQRVPEHQQEGQPGAYYFEPSLDGARPGIFFANLRNMDEVPKYGMETLAVHEAEPGHHFQIALQQQIDMPIVRKIVHYTAYVEGWALYAEKLAYENNFYSSSFSKLGHLRDEMMRAARLVVDTGIHYKRWTREQAIEYFQKYTGFHHDSVVSEIERYFVMPGQACAYKIGQLKILELRKRAQDALGDKFDIRQFHNIVLKIGAVPLTILEQEVERYIKHLQAI